MRYAPLDGDPTEVEHEEEEDAAADVDEDDEDDEEEEEDPPGRDLSTVAADTDES